jgi:hypothetical protein
MPKRRRNPHPWEFGPFGRPFPWFVFPEMPMASSKRGPKFKGEIVAVYPCDYGCSAIVVRAGELGILGRDESVIGFAEVAVVAAKCDCFREHAFISHAVPHQLDGWCATIAHNRGAA